MNLTDMVILGLLAALVAFTVVYNIRKRKKGGGCCGCGAKSSGCPGCSSSEK